MEIAPPTPASQIHLSFHHHSHRDNVTAPTGRPNLRSRLHFNHSRWGGPRSLKGHVVTFFWDCWDEWLIPLKTKFFKIYTKIQFVNSQRTKFFSFLNEHWLILWGKQLLFIIRIKWNIYIYYAEESKIFDVTECDAYSYICVLNV